MSNRRTHLIAGTSAGLGFAGYLARNEQPRAFAAETVGGALGGAIGCLGPDTVEPALHSWHRSTAHSYAAAATIVTATAQGIERWQEYCRGRAAQRGIRPPRPCAFLRSSRLNRTPQKTLSDEWTS
jgi:hypothetical protein